MSNQQWTKTLELRAGVAVEYIAGQGTTHAFILKREAGRLYIIVALGIRDYSAGLWAAIGRSTILNDKEMEMFA